MEMEMWELYILGVETQNCTAVVENIVAIHQKKQIQNSYMIQQLHRDIPNGLKTGATLEQLLVFSFEEKDKNCFSIHTVKLFLHRRAKTKDV